MREIKFRAWDKVTGTMYTDLNFPDNYLIDLNMDVWDTKKKGPFGLGEVVYNRFELIQFTGLKDKNGVEIYEGDIVFVDGDWEEFGFMAGETREVYFDNGGFRLKPKDKYSKGHWLEDVGCYVIKGNIYQNSELLKD